MAALAGRARQVEQGLMNLSGRVALVTGAGRRVGQAIALALGGKGMNVAGHYNGSSSGASETVAQLASLNAEGRVFQADLSSPDGPSALVAKVAEEFGGIDVVVNS